jgi:AcrR family transcriptional regulator
MVRTAHDEGHHHRHEHRHPVRRAPGRPRSEAAEKAILDAVVDLFGEGVPYGTLSVEQIAARAGVGKATLYRRWPNKEVLVVDAIASLQQPCPVPDFSDGRTVREYLVATLRWLCDGMVSDKPGLVFGAVMAESMRHPELVRRYQQTVIEPRRDILRMILRHAVDSGELRADLDIELALRMVVAPMLMYVKTERPGETVPEGFIEQQIDYLLHGLAKQ